MKRFIAALFVGMLMMPGVTVGQDKTMPLGYRAKVFGGVEYQYPKEWTDAQFMDKATPANIKKEIMNEFIIPCLIRIKMILTKASERRVIPTRDIKIYTQALIKEARKLAFEMRGKPEEYRTIYYTLRVTTCPTSVLGADS